MNLHPIRKSCSFRSPDSSGRLPQFNRASMRLARPLQMESESSIPNISDSFPIDITASEEENRPRQYGRAALRRQRSEVAPNESVIDNDEADTTSSNNTATTSVDESSNQTEEPISLAGNNSEHPPRSDAAEIPAPTAHRRYEMNAESESRIGQWSHSLSSTLACLSCTLGIFNISRFAIFSIHFGSNFILQFLVLTILFGVPLLTFHVSFGQLLGNGIIDMWHISPIFKGIGFALLLSQALIGIYSIIGVSWMFIYLRDSFISKQDVYRWAEPLELYAEDGTRTLPVKFNNVSFSVEQTVAEYFSGVVLQRRSVLKPPEDDLVNIKASSAFNLAIVWIIVFLCLSKGLKSYGKVVYVVTLIPLLGMFLLCAKLLELVPIHGRTRLVFPDTDWNEFFLNSKSWVVAFTEVFLTWGVLGASAMQISSHNRVKNQLHRDVAFVVLITTGVLLMSAFIGNVSNKLLNTHRYFYVPSSFEKPSTYVFLQKHYPQSNTPVRWMQHSGLIMGERTIKPGSNVYQESGYQSLRLATELIPALLAVVGSDVISPFWSVLFYFTLIMFGIAQQLAIWYSVIAGIISTNVKVLKPAQSTITWFACVCGFVLGLPMTTEMGIFVTYFLDYTIGCAWWIIALYLLELGAVFIVRGRPYSGETIVATLFVQANSFLQIWVAPAFTFNWNVILPVTLLLLSTSIFKHGGYRMLYNWHSAKYYEYWPPWSRRLAFLLQVGPLVIVPLVAIVQTYRYLTKGPPDLFDRIQSLYRPVIETGQNLQSMPAQNQRDSIRSNGVENVNISIVEDPPPKYTPPPSYSTVTGARLAKLLRQSLRRSVRRITQALNPAPLEGATSSSTQTQLPPPPDYATVLVEIHESMRQSRSPSNLSASGATLTAEHVATILRGGRSASLPTNLTEQECSSIQCLVESVEPINRDSIIVLDSEKVEEKS